MATQVIRMFAFNNGQNSISSMPIQDPVSAFMRFL